MEPEIKAIQQRDDLQEIRNQLTSYLNCHATGISFRDRDSQSTRDFSDPCIVAYVEQKVPEEDLRPEDRIPREINGVSVDVRQRESFSEPEPMSDPDPNHIDLLNASPLRAADIRPMIAGFENSTAGGSNDNSGTMCAIVEDSGGSGWCVTAGHIAEGTGVDMYQPYEDTNQADNNLVGATQYYSSYSSGHDYAVYPSNDTTRTNLIAGFGKIDKIGEPTFKDRLFMSGIRRGIHGHRLDSIDVETSGTNFDYIMHPDHLPDDTSPAKDGDSGSPCFYIDDNGDLVLFGIYSGSPTADTEAAADIDEVMSLGFQLDTSDYSLPDPDTADFSGTTAFYEGTLASVNKSASVGTFQVANMGGTTESRTVETIDPDDGTVIDSTSVTLDPLRSTQVNLALPETKDHVEFQVQDMGWLIDYSYFPDQQITNFSEYPTGSFPTSTDDWTSRWASANFNIESDASSPGGQSLVYDESGNSTTEPALVTWDGKDASDVEIAALVTETGNKVLHRPAVRASGATGDGTDSCYFAAIDSNGNLSIVLQDGGSNNTLQEVAKNPTTPFWYRFRVNGTNLSLKAWEKGTQEPSSWDVTATDSTLSSGWVGWETAGSQRHGLGALGVGLHGETAPTAIFNGFAVAIDTTNSPVDEGQTLTVDATITNEGSSEQTQDIDLDIE